MKTKKLNLILFISTSLFWMNQAQSKEIKIPGVLKSSSTTQNGSNNTRTDSYTCNAGSKVCITIQTNSADSTSVTLPYLTEECITPGQVVTLIVEGQPDVSGVFVEYTNSPVPNEDITTRTHSFTLSTN